jgi:O-antigen ligase
MILASPPRRRQTPVKVQGPASAPRLAAGVISALGLGFAGAAIGLVALYVSVPAAGIVYAVAYMILTWVRPDLALMLMFAAAPFPYDLGGGSVKMALAEIDLVLAAPVLLVRAILRHQKFASNPIKWPVLAYFIVCIVSSLHGGLNADSVKSMAQMAIYMILAVFVFSSCVNDLRLIYAALYGLLLAAAVLATLGVITRQEYLLGIHKNSIGTSLSYAVIVCGELWFAERDPRRRWRLAILECILLGGLVFSLSRGAWVAAAFGLGVVAAIRGEFRLLLRGMTVAALVILICWQLVPKARQQYATDLASDSYNVKTRLISIQYAMHYFETSPVVGVGVGLRKGYDATNVVMSTLAETGVLGLVTFMSIFLVLGWSLWSARRQIPARDPAFSLLAIGLALALAQFLHGLVDHYWSRSLLIPWAATGIALFARHNARNKKPVR